MSSPAIEHIKATMTEDDKNRVIETIKSMRWLERQLQELLK